MAVDHPKAVEIEIDGQKWAEAYAGGFELYLPPSPMLNEKSNPPNAGRFVIVDDLNNTFYDINYDAARNLSKHINDLSWTELALHTVIDAAIVLPSLQWESLQDESKRFGTGFLVNIASRESDVFYARRVGSVFVRKTDQKHMNWSVLRSWKGPEIVAEMQNGLLRQLWNRRAGINAEAISYRTPARILNNMPRPWYKNGESLNWELDHQFAGCVVMDSSTKWRLQAWGPPYEDEASSKKE